MDINAIKRGVSIANAIWGDIDAVLPPDPAPSPAGEVAAVASDLAIVAADLWDADNPPYSAEDHERWAAATRIRSAAARLTALAGGGTEEEGKG